MAKESKAKLQQRAGKIVELLHRMDPDAHCTLDFKDPLQLLVATILSAQCTDVRVNQVTPALFKKYPTTKAFAGADLNELMQDIRSTGFYRNKAKAIQAAARDIAARHSGKVPKAMEELVQLPGVGRKTANVVLGSAYGIAAGVVVDTHVARVSQRLALTRQKDPEKIERDLMALTPQADWTFLAHALILHGRNVCKARKPDCAACQLAALCPSAYSFPHNKKRG